MTYTENYQLNQWAKTDRIQMSDFNADNAKIDAALAEKANIVTGTYTGSGAASRDISLGAKPRFVLVWQAERHDIFSSSFTGCGAACGDLNTSFQGHPAVTLTDDGFRVYYTSFYYNERTCIIGTNSSDTVYSYLAVF